MIKLSQEKVLLLHEIITEETGGSPSVRDMALLDSALESAFATFGGEELYKTREEKGARLGFSLIQIRSRSSPFPARERQFHKYPEER